MLILGIETSCDETAAAVVQNGTKILSNVIASSQSLHAKYGGIIPEKAAREQIKSIIPVIHESLVTSHQSLATIDAIAVTIGPGLIGSLLIGVETAKALAFAWDKPIIPVNHLIGHIYANWFTAKPEFPALVLLVSGGHTQLILMKDHGKFKLIGETRDDTAGECFDKCARLLGLGYPGGPAVAAAAAKYLETSIQYPGKVLPRPMINNKSFDFSFSGLKTAVSRLFLDTKYQSLNTNYLAHELQEAVCDVLVSKTLEAAEKYQVKNILLAGGVAANIRLREKMQLQISNFKLKIPLHIPEFALCTDNAACIASAAFFNYKEVPWQKIDADPSLTTT